MLAALQKGVKGGKWHSLIYKVSRLETLSWGGISRTLRRGGWGKPNERGTLRASTELLSGRTGGRTEGRKLFAAAGKACVHNQNQWASAARYTCSVKDRLLQAALKLVIEPIFEYEFEPKSFGFRQGLGCKDVLREVDCHLKAGYFWVVDVDLQSYFDTIPHAAQFAKVGNRIGDGRVLELVEQFLNPTYRINLS